MPEGLDVSLVIEALREGWDFAVDVAEYAAVGGGSYHWKVADKAGLRGFVTVDDLDQKTWLGATRAAAFDGFLTKPVDLATLNELLARV